MVKERILLNLKKVNWSKEMNMSQKVIKLLPYV